MTTVGVDPGEVQRINPMNIPSYSYQYPSHRRVQLAAVKDGLFHPNLPSFRRMDMDTAGHKLPDEHCRTTTSCGPGEWLKMSKRDSTLLSNPSVTTPQPFRCVKMQPNAYVPTKYSLPHPILFRTFIITTVPLVSNPGSDYHKRAGRTAPAFHKNDIFVMGRCIIFSLRYSVKKYKQDQHLRKFFL